MASDRHWTFGGPLCESQHREAADRGEMICRECGVPVSPPRLSWCSQECVDAYRKRCRGVRDLVWERDKGVCVMCGTDCAPPPDHPQLPFGYYGEWDADHTIPLVEGGDHSLDNMRTLCKPCHRTETTKLRARLAQKEKQMNETLDVLRYWLSEWRFFPPDGKLYTSLGFITGEGLRGNVCRTMDTDHLCAELRRKYLEREEVWLVESVANKKPEGSSVSPFVTVIEMSHGACYIGPGDSELSATIAAGKALMDALCGGGK